MESFAEQSEFLLARKKLSTKLAANWRNKNRSKKKYPGQSLIKKLPPPLLYPPSKGACQKRFSGFCPLRGYHFYSIGFAFWF